MFAQHMDSIWGSAPQISYDGTPEENDNEWLEECTGDKLPEGTYVRALFKIRGQVFVQLPYEQGNLPEEYTNALKEAELNVLPNHYLAFGLHPYATDYLMCYTAYRNIPFHSRTKYTYGLMERALQSDLEIHERFINFVKNIFGCFGQIYAGVLKYQFEQKRNLLIDMTTLREVSIEEDKIWSNDNFSLNLVFPVIVYMGKKPVHEDPAYTYKQYIGDDFYTKQYENCTIGITRVTDKQFKLLVAEKYYEAIRKLLAWDKFMTETLKWNHGAVIFGQSQLNELLLVSDAELIPHWSTKVPERIVANSLWNWPNREPTIPVDIPEYTILHGHATYKGQLVWMWVHELKKSKLKYELIDAELHRYIPLDKYYERVVEVLNWPVDRARVLQAMQVVVVFEDESKLEIKLRNAGFHMLPIQEYKKQVGPKEWVVVSTRLYYFDLETNKHYQQYTLPEGCDLFLLAMALNANRMVAPLREKQETVYMLNKLF